MKIYIEKDDTTICLKKIGDTIRGSSYKKGKYEGDVIMKLDKKISCQKEIIDAKVKRKRHQIENLHKDDPMLIPILM